MSSDAYPAASSGSDGGGAFGPRPRSRVLIGVAVVIFVAVAVTAGLLIGNSGAASRRASSSTYGSYPSWLPHTKPSAVGTIVKASLAHPQLDAIEGSTMQVQLPSGAEAEITAVGPSFPTWVSAAAQAGTLSEGSAVPATFTVTVIARRGTVPLRTSAFSILTAAGQLVHPAISGPGGKPAPAALRAGQHLNLTVEAKLTEGDGSLRWAPTGARVVSAWLYQLELD